jgi:hypothetical protein
MSRRWFQFRLRTLLIAMTLVAVAIVLVQRSQRFRETARRHAIGVSMASSAAESVEVFHLRYGFQDRVSPPAPESVRKAEEWRELAAYHQRLQAKYERAAWLPFLPVAPDPPRKQPERHPFLRHPYEWRD